MLAHPGFIKAIRLNRDEASDSAAYPFCLPAIRALERLELSPRVTFFVGEN